MMAGDNYSDLTIQTAREMIGQAQHAFDRQNNQTSAKCRKFGIIIEF